MTASKLLKKIHNELCPNIPLSSEAFTYRLIEEIQKLRDELKDEGG